MILNNNNRWFLTNLTDKTLLYNIIFPYFACPLSLSLSLGIRIDIIYTYISNKSNHIQVLAYGTTKRRIPILTYHLVRARSKINSRRHNKLQSYCREHLDHQGLTLYYIIITCNTSLSLCTYICVINLTFNIIVCSLLRVFRIRIKIEASPAYWTESVIINWYNYTDTWCNTYSELIIIGRLIFSIVVIISVLHIVICHNNTKLWLCSIDEWTSRMPTNT